MSCRVAIITSRDSASLIWQIQFARATELSSRPHPVVSLVLYVCGAQELCLALSRLLSARCSATSPSASACLETAAAPQGPANRYSMP